MAENKKEEVEIIEAEIIEEISEPDYDFKDKKLSRKQPRGTRKKDFPEFTEARREQLIQFMTLGTPPKIAAKTAGIHPDTLDNWMTRGEEAAKKLDAGEELYPIEKDFADFYIRCNMASGNAITSLIGVIMQKARTNPYVAMKMLEKLDPEQFGLKQSIEMTGKVAHAHIHGSVGKIEGGEVAKNLTTKELRELREEFQKRKMKQLEAGQIEDEDDEA